MASICLCMIVRDEGAVIQRCLQSVRGLIDRWEICDTGSSDRTRELIHEALEDVPGQLHERPWIDFGHNRTELMGIARGKADYLLLIDADMTVSYDKPKLRNLRADSYMLRHAEDPEYRIKRLVRGDRRWWYVGATHEYIRTDGVDQVESLAAIVIHHHGDSGTRVEKFERDLRLLTGELERDPDNARTVFYLAQTHKDLGHLEESIDLYRRRAAMGGWPEEVFYGLYQVGVLTERVGRRDQAIPALFEAWNYRPQRVEPLYELAWMFRERGMHRAAHLVAQRGLGAPVPADSLFVHRWIYDWGLLFEYSIAAYWVGHPRAALQACKRLLELEQLPHGYREQTKINRAHCVRAIGRSSARSSTSTSESVAKRGQTSPATGTAGARVGRDQPLSSTPILELMRQVDGWMTEEEAELLIATAARAVGRFPSSHAVVEVGSYCGRSTVVLASVVATLAPDARVFAIDPHEGVVGAADAGFERNQPTYDRFRDNLVRAGVSDWVVSVRRRSYEVDWSDPIALLMIDGLHDFDNCARDFRHFEPWLGGDGYVVFHDYGSWPGVTAFVDELEESGAYERVKQAGSMVVLRRH